MSSRLNSHVQFKLIASGLDDFKQHKRDIHQSNTWFNISINGKSKFELPKGQDNGAK